MQPAMRPSRDEEEEFGNLEDELRIAGSRAQARARGLDAETMITELDRWPAAHR